MRDFPKHQNTFFAQDFSADGRLLASASVDDTVRLWNVETGERGQLVGWHQESAVSVAFSPDQKLLATAQEGGGGLVRVWRLRSDPPARTLPLEGTSRLALSADERWLLPIGWTDVNASVERTRVYRLGSFEPEPDMVVGGLLLGGAFAPDAAWVVLAVSSSAPMDRTAQVAAGDAGTGNLQFWDFRTGRRLGESIVLPVEPRAVAAHPDGRRVGIFGAGRSLYEFDRESGQLRELQAPGRFARAYEALNAACAYSPDGSVLLGTGRAIPPLLYRSGSGQRVPAAHLEEARVWNSAFHGDILATVTQDAQIDFTRVPDGARVGERIDDANWLFLAQFDASGQHFLTGGRSRAVRVWDWRQRRLACPALIHEREVFDGRFVPGAGQVVAGESEKVYFWDARLGQQLRPRWDVGAGLHEMRVLADGTLLVSRAATAERPAGIDVLDLRAALAPPDLPAEEMVALAELDAAAAIQNGALDPLTAADWLRRWQAFRARRPEWHRW